MTKTEEETMTNQQRMDFEKKMRECEEYIRHTGLGFDWVDALLMVVIMVLTVGGFTFNIVNVIRMLVEHKFAYWTAAINIFWAIVFLSQWVYHLAQTLMQKFR